MMATSTAEDLIRESVLFERNEIKVRYPLEDPRRELFLEMCNARGRQLTTVAALPGPFLCFAYRMYEAQGGAGDCVAVVATFVEAVSVLGERKEAIQEIAAISGDSLEFADWSFSH